MASDAAPDARRSTRNAVKAVKSMKDVSDSDSEHEEDEEDKGLGEDAPEAKPKKAVSPKQPTKKRKTPTKGSVPQAAPVKAVTPRKPRQAAAPAADLHNLSLLDIVSRHPASVEHAAKEWVARYGVNKAAATAELLTLVAQASGSHDTVSEADAEDGEADELATRLRDRAVEDGVTEVFKDRKLAAWRCPGGLRGSLSRFLDATMEELFDADRLFDDYVVDKLCNFTTALSVSVARPFRACGVLVMGALVSSWLHVLDHLGAALATALKQKEALDAKKAPKAQLLPLQRQVEQYHRRMTTLKDLIAAHFAAIFAIRFRDTCPDIRAAVVTAIGGWVLQMPDMFLVDSYLKYLAWSQSDKDPAVRWAAVEALLALYRAGDSTQVMRLHEFTGRFKSRFKELPSDIDHGVAVLGVQLLSRLVEVGELEREEVQPVFRLLADDSPELRGAAAHLVVRLLASEANAVKAACLAAAHAAAGPSGPTDGKEEEEAAETEEEAHEEEEGLGRKHRGGKNAAAALSKRNRAARAGVKVVGGAGLAESVRLAVCEAQLRRLTTIMAWLQTDDVAEEDDGLGVPSGGGGAAALRLVAPAPGLGGRAHAQEPLSHSEVAGLVDALYDKLPVMHDWRLLASTLGDDELREGRSECDNAHLAMLLAAALHRASVGGHPGGEGKAKGGPRSQALAPDPDAVQEASTTLMPLLPGLIRKYQTEPAVVSALVQMVPELRLELYSLQQEEAAFEELLKLVADALIRAGDETSIEAAAGALSRCARETTGSVQARAMVVLNATVSRLSLALVTAAKAVQALTSDDLAEAVEALGSSSALPGQQAATSGGATGGTPSRRQISGSTLAGSACDELYALERALQRTLALAATGSRAVALQSAVYDTVQFLLEDAAGGRFMGAHATHLAAHTALATLQWGLVKVLDDSRAGHSARDAVKQVVSRRDAFAGVLVNLFDAPHPRTSSGIDEGQGEGGAGGPCATLDALLPVAADFVLLFGDAEGGKYKGTGLSECPFVLPDALVSHLWAQCQAILLRSSTHLPHGGGAERVEDEEAEEAQRAQQEELEAGGPVRDGAVSSKVHALVAVGRLLGAHTLSADHFLELGANLVTHWAAHGAEVGELVRLVCCRVRRMQPTRLADMLAAGMQRSYADVLQVAALQEEEGKGGSEEAQAVLVERQQAFATLCKCVATLYAGHNLSRPELLQLLRSGYQYALQEVPQRLAFLAWGLSAFSTKVSAADALVLVEELKAAAAEHLPDDEAEEDERWRPYHVYTRGLQEKASKGRITKGVLKASTPGAPPAAAAMGGAKKRAGRKISFAGPNELSSDEEPPAGDNADEVVEEEEEEERQAAPQAKRGRRSGAVGGGPPRGHVRGGKAAAAAAPAHQTKGVRGLEDGSLHDLNDDEVAAAQAAEEEDDAPLAALAAAAMGSGSADPEALPKVVRAVRDAQVAPPAVSSPPALVQGAARAARRAAAEHRRVATPHPAASLAASGPASQADGDTPPAQDSLLASGSPGGSLPVPLLRVPTEEQGPSVSLPHLTASPSTGGAGRHSGSSPSRSAAVGDEEVEEDLLLEIHEAPSAGAPQQPRAAAHTEEELPAPRRSGRAAAQATAGGQAEAEAPPARGAGGGKVAGRAARPAASLAASESVSERNGAQVADADEAAAPQAAAAAGVDLDLDLRAGSDDTGGDSGGGLTHSVGPRSAATLEEEQQEEDAGGRRKRPLAASQGLVPTQPIDADSDEEGGGVSQVSDMEPAPKPKRRRM